ncbi:p21-Rho-binding domain protein [Cooperia oncophora]
MNLQFDIAVSNEKDYLQNVLDQFPFQVVGLKPLPKEPSDSGKKKKSMSNPFVKKNREKKEVPEKPVISEPSNFEHTVHVGYDPATGEFTVSNYIS